MSDPMAEYTYRVTWSDNEQEFVGLCAEIPLNTRLPLTGYWAVPSVWGMTRWLLTGLGMFAVVGCGSSFEASSADPSASVAGDAAQSAGGAEPGTAATDLMAGSESAGRGTEASGGAMASKPPTMPSGGARDGAGTGGAGGTRGGPGGAYAAGSAGSGGAAGRSGANTGGLGGTGGVSGAPTGGAGTAGAGPRSFDATLAVSWRFLSVCQTGESVTIFAFDGKLGGFSNTKTFACPSVGETIYVPTTDAQGAVAGYPRLTVDVRYGNGGAYDAVAALGDVIMYPNKTTSVDIVFADSNAQSTYIVATEPASN